MHAPHKANPPYSSSPFHLSATLAVPHMPAPLSVAVVPDMIPESKRGPTTVNRLNGPMVKCGEEEQQDRMVGGGHDPTKDIGDDTAWLDHMAALLRTTRRSIPGDGNCLFGALASQCRGDITAASLRAQVTDSMRTNAEYRSNYTPDTRDPNAPITYDAYVEDMSCDRRYGDHWCLQTAAVLLNAEVWVLNASEGSRGNMRREGSSLQPVRLLGLTYRPMHYDILNIPMALHRSLRSCSNDTFPLPGGPASPASSSPNRRQRRHTAAARLGNAIKKPSSNKPLTLTITSMNITSLGTHSMKVPNLPGDILTLQETRAGADIKGTMQQYFSASNWTTHWGKDLVKTGIGVRQQIPPGGVATLTKGHLTAQALNPVSEVEKRCYESTRVVHTAVAVGGGAALHIINVYAHSGANAAAQREELLTDVFDMANALGQAVPVLIIGDLNCNSDSSGVLAAAERSGRWVDVAASIAAARTATPNHTCKSATATGFTTSRIDLCLANITAAPAVTKADVTTTFEECPFPSHLPLSITLDLETYSGQTSRCVLPKAFPATVPREIPAPAAAMAGAIEKKERNGLTGAQILTEFANLGEDYLILLHDGDTSPTSQYRGRGKKSQVKTSRHATKHCNAKGATTDLTRARDAVMGNLRTILQHMEARLQVDRPYAMTRTEEHSWRALTRHRGGPLKEELAEALALPSPDLQTLQRLLEKLTGSNKEAFLALKSQRSLQWKQVMQNAYAGCKGQGMVFDFVADRFTTPAAFMRQHDGTLTADPKKIDALLLDNEAWGGIFRRYVDSPEPSWNEFLDTYETILPHREPMECEQITVDDVRSAIGRLKRTTSPGMHGWRAFELQQLPDSVLALLAEGLNAIERDGVWPEDLMQALVPLIPKPESDANPLSQRPITITAVLYRVWASVRAKSAFPWLEKLAPEGLHGCRPKHGTEDLYWHLAAQLECAHLSEGDMYGVAIDFQKCFDTVPIEITFQLAARLGFNEVVLTTLREAYARMTRHFKCNGSIGQPFVPTNGIMQGCPLSVILINIVVSVWMRDVESRGAEAASYVDDIYATASTHELQQDITDRTVIFSQKTQMAISTSKSHTFSTCDTPPCELKAYDSLSRCLVSQSPPIFLPERNSFDCTGAMVHAKPTQDVDNLPVSDRIAKRRETAVENLRRVKSLPTPVQHRDHVASMSAGSKCYYAASTTYMSPKEQKNLTTKFTAAVWTGTNRRAPEVVLHVLQHGHRMDPSMVLHLHRLRAWAKQMRKASCRPLATAAWQNRDSLTCGPFHLISLTLRALGWTWQSPTSISFVNEAGDAATLELSTLTDKQVAGMEAEARHFLRTEILSKMANRRPDFEGMQHGVDGHTTRHLLEDSANELTGYQKGILRSVIAGAVNTTGRSGLSTTSCPYCVSGERETVEHLWWDCQAWSSVRARHSITSQDRTNWPNCLSICGVAPAFRQGDNALPQNSDDRRFIVRSLQRFFVEVVKERQIRADRPEESARHHRLQSFPWGWSSPQPRQVHLPVYSYESVRQQWKHNEDLWHALNSWVRGLQWAHVGSEHSISLIELAVDFELTTGMPLPDVGSRRYPQFKASTSSCTVRDHIADHSGVEMFFDGGARQNKTVFARAGAGAVVYVDGVKSASVATPLPSARSNNVAEYEGVISGLRLLNELPSELQGPVTISGDSKLIVDQLRGVADCNDFLKPLFLVAKELIREVQPRFTLGFRHIARERNKDADALSNQAMDEVENQKQAELAAASSERDTFLQSALAKSLSLGELMQTFAKVYKPQSWMYGHYTNVTSLTAIGGSVTSGVSKRAVLNSKTEEVLRHLQSHIAAFAGNRRSLLYEETQAWAAQFRPQEHYADDWTEASAGWRGRATEARAAGRARPPRTAPPDARKCAKTLSCLTHGKVRCNSCKTLRAAPETCCSLHHTEGDGRAIVMDFCTKHRLTRCGACLLDKKSLAQCCGTCHTRHINNSTSARGTLPLHHRQDPAGSSQVT